jgi:hypothetical protein
MSLREVRATFADPFRTPVSALVHVVEQDEDTLAARSVIRRLASRVGRATDLGLDRVLGLVLETLSAKMALRALARSTTRRVRDLTDVERLALWEVDEAVEHLPVRYLAASAALGLFAGSRGSAGIILGAPLVLGLAVRAIGDVALHYGFDPRVPAERRFVRDVLLASLTPAASVRSASIDELLAAAVVGVRAWNRRRSGLGAPLVLRLARRLVRAGLSRDERRSVARLGSIAAAAVNGWLLVGVMRAARSAYRVRFLERASLR